jgi:hypothetical protein
VGQGLPGQTLQPTGTLYPPNDKQNNGSENNNKTNKSTISIRLQVVIVFPNNKKKDNETYCTASMMNTVPGLYQFWERSLTESRFSLYGTIDAVVRRGLLVGISTIAATVGGEEVEVEIEIVITGRLNRRAGWKWRVGDSLLSTLMMAWLSELTYASEGEELHVVSPLATSRA